MVILLFYYLSLPTFLKEKKELLISVLEGKKSIDDVAKHLIDPQEIIIELIMDLENHFKEKLLKLNNLKTKLGMS